MATVMSYTNLIPKAINLENVPNQMISGLDDDVVNWVCEQSNNRFIEELSSTFANTLQEQEDEGCGFILSTDIEDELNEIEKASVPFSTKQQMVTHCKKISRIS